MSYILALKAGHQNIQGGGKTKLSHADLINKIKQHHLFGAQETKLGKENAVPDIEGYVKYRSDRSKKGKRESGGSVVFVKKSITRGVSLLSKRNNAYSDVIWLRLRKDFFGLEADIILCYCYIVPEAKQETYDILNDEIIKYSLKGTITLLGDLNSRIGINPILHSEIVVKDDQTIIKSLHTPNRNCEDRKVNSNGRKLKKIMTNYNLFVANGTCLGDLKGKYTCVSWNGMSTNDMFLFDRKLLSRINYFKVNNEFDWYSDHKSVSISIRVNIYLNQNGGDGDWKTYTKTKLRWSPDDISKFKSILSNEIYKNQLNVFCSKSFEDVNSAEREFANILSNVLKETFPAIKKKINKRKNNAYKKACREEFSPIIQAAKRSFKKCQREFNVNQNDLNRRQKFIRERQKYKQTIYFTKKVIKENRINKVAGLESADPATFWKELKSLLNPNNDVSEFIGKNDWFNHFNELLNSPSALNQDQQFLEYIKSSLPRLELYAEDAETLNVPITTNEIFESVKDLKMGKSTYFDNIGNEVIKHGYDSLERPLNFLYNKVFDKCSFPLAWGEGIVVPLHKKEDKMDVNNYRGIIISSCVGKLFLRVINKRISKFMQDHGKWSKNQCGFKKDHRTEDNLFLLKNIHEKYVTKLNKKVYVAFVDFSKFFDKINRHIMLYKLLKYGLTGNIYSTIKSVYEKTTFCIKVGDKLSPPFDASNGLKQGCCMSPILSNIFQNDLHEIFGRECDPISIGSVVLNSISWADDLVLLSTSKEGLQKCLNKLSSYCKKWGLEVNVDKTKTMVFSKKADKTTTFHFNATILKNVQNIIYLGFNVSYNGSIQLIMSDRINKAKKVALMVLNALKSNKNVSTSLALSIYEKQIAPVLMYGCALWSVPRTGTMIYLENQPEGSNVRTRLNEIFSELFDTPKPFKYARRVGKLSVGASRRILIKLDNFDDKQEILAKNNANYTFSDYKDTTVSDVDKTYLDYCKRSLNISKYASNTATYFELGVYPIEHKMFSLAVKYWQRLASGTENLLLNEAYRENLDNNFEWSQGIKALLYKNGFGNVWQRPETVSKLTFNKIFKERLNNQFVQNNTSKLETSTRFEVLKSLIEYNNIGKRQRYITLIKNASIRESFTRLRTDINVLENAKQNLTNSVSGGNCNNCNRNLKETPGHLLFVCDKFSDLRMKSYNLLKLGDPSFNPDLMNRDDLLKYVLDLRCPDNSIAGCCLLVKAIYDARVELTKD